LISTGWLCTTHCSQRALGGHYSTQVISNEEKLIPEKRRLFPVRSIHNNQNSLVPARILSYHIDAKTERQAIAHLLVHCCSLSSSPPLHQDGQTIGPSSGLSPRHPFHHHKFGHSSSLIRRTMHSPRRNNISLCVSLSALFNNTIDQ